MYFPLRFPAVNARTRRLGKGELSERFGHVSRHKAAGINPKGIPAFSPALPDEEGLRWVTNQNGINPEGG